MKNRVPHYTEELHFTDGHIMPTAKHLSLYQEATLAHLNISTLNYFGAVCDAGDWTQGFVDGLYL